MKTTKWLGTFALGIAFVSPVIVKAQPAGRTAIAMYQDHDQQRREFKAEDDTAFHQWLKDQHKKDHDWSKASKREQQKFWKWRDAQQNQHRDDSH